MRLIRCTKKVLAEVGLPKNELCESAITQLPLGDWYVNIAKVCKRKCIIFVNEITLFSFPVFGIQKSRMKYLVDIFRTSLSEALRREEFEYSKIEKTLLLYKNIGIGKCSSRSVLGNMNDLAFHYNGMITDQGGFDICDVHKVAKNINRMPRKNLDWEYPIEKLKKAI